MIRSAEHVQWETTLLAGRIRADVHQAVKVGRDFERHMENLRRIVTTSTYSIEDMAASIRRAAKAGVPVRRGGEASTAVTRAGRPSHRGARS